MWPVSLMYPCKKLQACELRTNKEALITYMMLELGLVFIVYQMYHVKTHFGLGQKKK